MFFVAFWFVGHIYIFPLSLIFCLSLIFGSMGFCLLCILLYSKSLLAEYLTIVSLDRPLAAFSCPLGFLSVHVSSFSSSLHFSSLYFHILFWVMYSDFSLSPSSPLQFISVRCSYAVTFRLGHLTLILVPFAGWFLFCSLMVSRSLHVFPE